MSKKNNQGTRRNLHAARLEKEQEEAAKRAAKQARKQERVAEAAVKGVALPKRLKRKQKKGVRIRKNLVVRGIKVTDAESKQRIKELLAAEEAMKDLMMEMEGPAAEQHAAEAARQRGQEEKQRRVGVGGGAKVKGSSVKVKAGKAGKKEKKGKKGKAVGMALG